jgi:hypothetical protein
MVSTRFLLLAIDLTSIRTVFPRNKYGNATMQVKLGRAR